MISTAADLEDNLLLIEGLRAVNKKAIVVVIALNTDAAKTLYKAGADYVAVGSALFNTPDPLDALKKLEKIIG